MADQQQPPSSPEPDPTPTGPDPGSTPSSSPPPGQQPPAGHGLLHHHHGHHHDDIALNVVEEPLDPANQSLADALRMSFGVLKFVMVLLVGAFMVSGLVCVDQREVVVLARFGELAGDPRPPGLHLAWPYPVDEQIRVSTSLRTLTVDTFWLRLSDVDKTRSLSEVTVRGGGLDPAKDGALLTGDQAIMHLLLNVQYRVNDQVRVRAEAIDPADQVSDVVLFVKNVGTDREQDLLRSVIQNAAVAASARSTADIIWKDASRVADAVHKRAQRTLDEMETGITLDKVAAEQSYFPLQARREFLGVSTAENHKRQLINEAESEWAKKLLGVAGKAWEPLAAEIERLDQVEDETSRDAVIERITQIIVDQAMGEAGGAIRLAQARREKIVADTLAEVARFKAYLDEYRQSPELVRSRLRTEALNRFYEEAGAVRWSLAPGQKRLILSLNKDPKEVRQAERERIRKKARDNN